MAQTSTANNPFLFMMNPEAVIAAMERSERLSSLNRHLCRPLDKAQPNGVEPGADAEAGADGPQTAD